MLVSGMDHVNRLYRRVDRLRRTVSRLHRGANRNRLHYLVYGMLHGRTVKVNGVLHPVHVGVNSCASPPRVSTYACRGGASRGSTSVSSSSCGGPCLRDVELAELAQRCGEVDWCADSTRARRRAAHKVAQQALARAAPAVLAGVTARDEPEIVWRFGRRG